MNWLILKTHRLLLRTVVTITTLTVALSISFLVQQLDWNTRSELGSFVYFPVIGLSAILAFMCVPKLNELVVAPNRKIHIFVQVGVCLCGAVLITWTGLIAFHAPLAKWLGLAQFAQTLALGVGALYICLGVAGSFLAIVSTAYRDITENMNKLRRVHLAARALAAVFAFAISGIILGSILILKSPTTTTTIACSIVMLCFAAILGSSRMSVANFEKPIKLWNLAFQFLVVSIAVFAIKLSTRALTFHTHLFDGLSEMDIVYPRLENLLVLPFIVFGLTSIALILQRQKEAEDVTEVFA